MGYRRQDSLVKFESAVVQNALEDLLIHLSRATPRALRDAAQDVTGQLDELFHDVGLREGE